MKNLTVALALVVMVLPGCSGEPNSAQRVPRAVSCQTLTVSKPGEASRLTGTVGSWKREDIGFEVAGRVLRIVEPGVDIEGRTFDEKGNLLSEGTVLAELDAARYQIAAKQAQATADAARTDLEKVLPQQLAEAEAALALADKELVRYRNLVRAQSAPQQQLDTAETAQRAATAKVAQVEAARATKAALLQAALAAVEQTQVSIADCKLTSPFTGQIARVNVIPGGYALPGQSVVTVQMMAPMKIQLAVSPETDARVNFNDRVRVYLQDTEKFLEGYVYLKDTFADPATRTFLITLLVRNQKMITGIPDELKGKPVATTEKLWTLLPEKVGVPGNYFIEVNALHQDDEGYFVWRIDNLTPDQLYDTVDSVLQVSKVRVKPGEGRRPVLQVFTFRELVDMGDLDPATAVILGEAKGDVHDGGQVVLVHERWMLRPGDLVQVSLKGKESAKGFYVPEKAIAFDGQRTSIFVVRDLDDTSQQIVDKMEVKVSDCYGDLRRIEAIGSSELVEGAKVVVEGAQYVADGEKVNAIEEREVNP